MNNKGFISIHYLFSIFILIIIATFILFVATTYISSVETIEKHSSIRIILDDVCDDINQVNSNGEGYSKQIKLPRNIMGNTYFLEISNNKITIDCESKLAQNNIIPTYLVKNGVKTDKVELYGGNSYIIQKHEKSQISINQIWGRTYR